MMRWGNTTARCLNKIQTQQNYLIEIVNNVPLIQTKLAPLSEQLHLLKLNIIYELEVLKFACKFKMKTLSKCFENYFQLDSQVHIYSTRLTANENWSVPRLKKKKQTMINVQLALKIQIVQCASNADLRNNYLKTFAIFVKQLKQILLCNQLQFNLIIFNRFCKLAGNVAISSSILLMAKRIII